ncbi:uncharacterized protein [Choristoneura fumiferana]|uniref:uncharacterized protein n=1 Tax=Choristoneura fumiferana TaxID=7141 RepID=UPI003D15D177
MEKANIPVEEKSEVMAVAVSSRIPEFWVDQPRVWFIRTEAVLTPQKMSDESKFDMVVSKLPKEVIVQITDFLIKPPDTGKFEALKATLLTLLEDTKDRQIERMMVEMELGDQKASQLLRRMRDLGRDKFPEDTIRVLWQRLLPATVRAVLSATQTKNLDDLAVIADNVLEATRAGQIAAVAQAAESTAGGASTSRTTAPTDAERIFDEIAKLSVRLRNVEKPKPWVRTARGGQGPRLQRFEERPRARRTPNDPGWLCFYHFRFRERAAKCVQPCSWNPMPEN